MVAGRQRGVQGERLCVGWDHQLSEGTMAIADILRGIGGAVGTVGKAVAEEESGELPEIQKEKRAQKQKAQDQQTANRREFLTNQLALDQKYGTLTPEQRTQLNQENQSLGAPKKEPSIWQHLLKGGATYQQPGVKYSGDATPEGGTAAADTANAMQLAQSRTHSKWANWKMPDGTIFPFDETSGETPPPGAIKVGTGNQSSRLVTVGKTSIQNALRLVNAGLVDYKMPDGRTITNEMLQQLPPYMEITQIRQGDKDLYIITDQRTHIATIGNERYQVPDVGGVLEQASPLGQARTPTTTTDPFGLTQTTAPSTPGISTGQAPSAPIAPPQGNQTPGDYAPAPAGFNHLFPHSANEQLVVRDSDKKVFAKNTQTGALRDVKASPSGSGQGNHVVAQILKSDKASSRQLDESGHVPENAGNPMLVQAANQLLDGMDINKLPIPTKAREAASQLATEYGWHGQGLFAPKEILQLKEGASVIDQMLNSDSLDVLDAGTISKLPMIGQSTDPSKAGFLGRAMTSIASGSASPKQQEFMRQWRQLDALALGLRALVQTGRATQAQVDRIIAEFPNPYNTTSAEDAKERLRRVQNELRVAAETGKLPDVPLGNSPTDPKKDKGQSPVIQRSKKTGLYRYSLDGGKTWQPGQPPQQ
jgi:hypothetical protein